MILAKANIFTLNAELESIGKIWIPIWLFSSFKGYKVEFINF